MPQLGDFKLQRADPGVQVAFPVAAGMAHMLGFGLWMGKARSAGGADARRS
jgi:hypothetical protein